MARTGSINNFYFDAEVFADYMQEKSTFKDAIIASGIIKNDPLILDMLGEKGNVGSIPLFTSIDGMGDALNFDGTTDNTPEALTGKKMTVMKIGRMKAWKDADFTRYLIGAAPLQNLADNLVGKYYLNQWQKTLLSILTGVMGVSGLATHVTDITSSTSTVTDTNKVSETSLIDLGVKALGDNAGTFGLILMHSVVYGQYQKLGLVNFNKYTIEDALRREVDLPTIHGKIVAVDDSLVDTTGTNPVYSTYLVGEGAILGADCAIPTPYYEAYDAETDGGINKLYTKQAKVLHPNGMSIVANNITAESPTNTELATAANWSLAYNAKNVPIAVLKSNG